MAGSTPIYGFPYPQSTDLVADYPTLGQELATDVETVISGLGSGLNIITPTSIANSGGTATRTNGQVVFSGVSSISLNSVFTSTYDNYRIVISQLSSSASATVQMRLRVGGTDNSSAVYNYFAYQVAALSANVYRASANTYWDVAQVNTGFSYGAIYDMQDPNLVRNTNGTYNSTGRNGTPDALCNFGGVSHYSSTAFDGFTLYPSTGNITGTVRVYGYKNS